MWLLMASFFLCPNVYGEGEFQGQTFTQLTTEVSGPSGLEHNPRATMEGFHKVLFSGSIMNGLTKGIFDQHQLLKVFLVVQQERPQTVIRDECVIEFSRDDILFSYGVSSADGLSDYWFEWDLKAFEESSPPCLQNGEWADGEFLVTMEWEFDIGGESEFFYDEDYRFDFIIDMTPPALRYRDHIEFPDYDGIDKPAVVSGQPILATLQCGDRSRCLCSSNTECADPNGGVDRNAFTILGNFCDTDTDDDGQPDRLCEGALGRRTLKVWDTAGNSASITPDFFHYDSVPPTLTGQTIERFNLDEVIEIPEGNVNEQSIRIGEDGRPLRDPNGSIDQEVPNWGWNITDQDLRNKLAFDREFANQLVSDEEFHSMDPEDQKDVLNHRRELLSEHLHGVANNESGGRVAAAAGSVFTIEVSDLRDDKVELNTVNPRTESSYNLVSGAAGFLANESACDMADHNGDGKPDFFYSNDTEQCEPTLVTCSNAAGHRGEWDQRVQGLIDPESATFRDFCALGCGEGMIQDPDNPQICIQPACDFLGESAPESLGEDGTWVNEGNPFEKHQEFVSSAHLSSDALVADAFDTPDSCRWGCESGYHLDDNGTPGDPNDDRCSPNECAGSPPIGEEVWVRSASAPDVLPSDHNAPYQYQVNSRDFFTGNAVFQTENDFVTIAQACDWTCAAGFISNFDGTTCIPEPVDGSCGVATLATEWGREPLPSDDLCEGLTEAEETNLIVVDASDPNEYSWTCPGSFGGRSADCIGLKPVPAPECGERRFQCINSRTGYFHSGGGSTPPLWSCIGARETIWCNGTIVPRGRCGSHHENTDMIFNSSNPPTDLCRIGDEGDTLFQGPTHFTWRCRNGEGGGEDCWALTDKEIVGDQGECGSADGVWTNTAPSIGRCKTGAPSSPNGNGGTGFTWTCSTAWGTDNCSTPGRNMPSCGSANGVATRTAPTTNLCSRGTTPGVTSNTNSFDWDCSNIHGTTSCSASRPTGPACGSADGGTFASLSSGDSRLCASGEDRSLSDDGATFTWRCWEGNSTSSGQCSATKESTVGTPICGAANGIETINPPSSELCSAGTPSAVTTGVNAHTWTCGNSGGSANCSAPNPPQCGTAHGQSFDVRVSSSSHPQAGGSNLCANGNDQGFLSNAADWTWNCVVGSGSTPCSATKTGIVACGAADEQIYDTLSATDGDLCGAGETPVSFAFSGSTNQWTWNCQSGTGDTSSQCRAYKRGGPVSVAGCGDANDFAFDTLASTSPDLCETGATEESFITDSEGWSWACRDDRSGTVELCSADLTAACGAADGALFTILNNSNPDLCDRGTPNGLSFNNAVQRWDWDCRNTQGSSIVPCSASLGTNVTCGSANGGVFGSLSEGSSGLCNGGGSPTNFNDSALNEWTWDCSDGSTTRNCSATRLLCGVMNGRRTQSLDPTSNGLCSPGPAIVSPFVALTDSNKKTPGWRWRCKAGREANADGPCETSANRCRGIPGTGEHRWESDGIPAVDNQSYQFSFESTKTSVACQWGCVAGYERDGNTCTEILVSQDGVCGTADGVGQFSVPTSGLCEQGDPTAVSPSVDYPIGATGSYDWTCQGINGGEDAPCSLPFECATGECFCDASTLPDAAFGAWAQPVQGEAPNQAYVFTEARSHTEFLGSAYATDQPKSCRWGCQAGFHLFGNECKPDPVCDPTSDGQTFLNPPLGNRLCSVGTASPMNGRGNSSVSEWTWTCSNEGMVKSCSTTKQVLDGVCGSATTETGLVNPPTGASNLCSIGTPSLVTPVVETFDWTCSGFNGGETIGCQAQRAKSCAGTRPADPFGSWQSSAQSLNNTTNFAFSNALTSVGASPCSWGCESGYHRDGDSCSPNSCGSGAPTTTIGTWRVTSVYTDGGGFFQRLPQNGRPYAFSAASSRDLFLNSGVPQKHCSWGCATGYTRNTAQDGCVELVPNSCGSAPGTPTNGWILNNGATSVSQSYAVHSGTRSEAQGEGLGCQVGCNTERGFTNTGGNTPGTISCSCPVNHTEIGGVCVPNSCGPRPTGFGLWSNGESPSLPSVNNQAYVFSSSTTHVGNNPCVYGCGANMDHNGGDRSCSCASGSTPNGNQCDPGGGDEDEEGGGGDPDITPPGTPATEICTAGLGNWEEEDRLMAEDVKIFTPPDNGGGHVCCKYEYASCGLQNPDGSPASIRMTLVLDGWDCAYYCTAPGE